MQISYFGLSSFKITGKETTSIIDPFGKDSGLTPPRGAADLIILSEKGNEMYSWTSGISGEPFIVDGPGEYDVKEHTITGIPVKDKNGRVVTIYLIEVEGIKILHIAHIEKLSLSEDELEDIGDVDVMLVPVGGNGVLTSDDAAKAVNFIEPKFVIPMHFKTPSLKIHADSEEKFLKEFGNKFEKMEKLVLKKKDLLTEQPMKIIMLEPLR
ncbi:MAG: Zn-dependent hydrolase of the beta-lactamase fold-like protein [Candidatus Doudnabacteria bacterium Gr01-1014_77]|jgi:L-ascorbate metabolism protein UlaG (beta-lactamase superfamily)|uniref:Zn-dependent hydrolase of the beta-lactamase fold-like protein n=1 Tax=Candidatus Doudnabacteria bacterium Gr01-1014_77 TaxID=2017133 RepID=A0A554JBK1_9BACT|nr:MAG: Zn-dependent hydrolase of the beta-lactamase fold-like protein [Candidatus Doudnabacteria bacterium Gr01-1014_77]